MFGQVEDLLGDLVAFPTVSRQPNVELQDWLARRLEGFGASVSMVGGDDAERTNLHAILGPKRPGGLLLSGHTDVVDAGGGWASDPWTLVSVNERLYGRGSADMKGFFAAALVAISGIDVSQLTAPLHLVASYDEEIGCQGVRDILPTLAADHRTRPDLVIIGEPTMMTPRHAHMGKEVHRLTVSVPEAHSSQWASAPSAIALGAEVLDTLHEIQNRGRSELGAAGSVYSLNVGTVRGGSQPNVIAGTFEVTFEVRHSVGCEPSDVLAPLRAKLDELEARVMAAGGRVERELLVSYPAMSTDPMQPAFQRAEALADNGPSSTLGFGTEGGLFAAAVQAPIMICGPGDIAAAHRPDEFVTSEQLERCVRFIRSAIEEFCMTPTTNP